MTLEEIKNTLANEHYSTPLWMLLKESQQANLVDLVAMNYAIEQIKSTYEKLNKQISETK